MLSVCVLVGLDWAELIMQFSFACHMFMHSHAHVLFFQYILIYLNCFQDFSECFFLPPHSLVYVNASWHLNVNLLHLETFFILGHLLLLILPPLLFDEQARKDFSKNFSRQGIHSEHQVILSDFFDTNLPTIIHNRGWESLCDILVTYPFVLIQEFYSNMHGFDYSVLISLLTFEVRALLSHQRLSSMCSVS